MIRNKYNKLSSLKTCWPAQPQLVICHEGPKFCPEAARPACSWEEAGHTMEPRFSGGTQPGTKGSPEGWKMRTQEAQANWKEGKE